MKKILSFFILSVITFFSYSQISLTPIGSNYIIHDNPEGVDYLFIVNGVDLSHTLEYDNYVTGDEINWYRFDNPSVSISNIETLSPDGDTGYILIVNGKKYTIWIVDYQNYLIDFQKLEVDMETYPHCEEINLKLAGNIPQIHYTDSTGVQQELKREFSLKYDTKEWKDDSKEWAVDPKDTTIILPLAEIKFTTPLKDTKFTLTGDQFAESLGINPTPSIESDTYYTVRSEFRITTIASLREELNEDERPSEEEQIKGSAPLQILFKSNPSSSGNHYAPICLWTIYQGNNPLVTRNDENHRYTFHVPGTYKVALQLKTMAGDFCITDTTTVVEVSESALQVPNVFTPNGDGKNDEFRVAYRSLESYECRVYNNWGNLVYHGTNPDKGWDGKIRGKDASPGAYFYIIQAKGTDGIKYKKKGDVNLIR